VRFLNPAWLWPSQSVLGGVGTLASSQAPPLAPSPWPSESSAWVPVPGSTSWLSATGWHPLSRVHLGLNESAWGHLWLEIPDSAAPDSVVMVTVIAVGRGASPMPPTHAFLRLLVLAPERQVRHSHLSLQEMRARGGQCRLHLAQL
jgi:hypothetical protein